MLGDFVGGQRLFNVGFHQQYRLSQLGMAGTQTVLQRNALALAPFTNALHHQLFGHRARQLGTVVAGQHGKQQIQHRHAPTGTEAIAVPVKQVTGGNHLGETLGKVILPTPVNGRTITVQQPQLRQRIDTRRQPADHAPGPHHLLKGGAQRRGHGARRLVGQQKELLAALKLAGPRLAG